MLTALSCERCGAELPSDAASAAVQCRYCGATSVPVPRVVERVVERVVVVEAAGRQSGSTTNVPCPRCGHALGERSTGQHLVRGCETCGGVFLEPSGVTTLEQTRDESILRTAASFIRLLMPFALDRRPALTCPFCRQALRRRDLGETGHSIDTCDQHGTFFDRGELLAFADFCRERRAGELSDDDLENAGIKKGFW